MFSLVQMSAAAWVGRVGLGVLQRADGGGPADGGFLC